MKQQSNLYNFSTKFIHKVLKRPIYLKKSFDINQSSKDLTVIFLHGISADSSTWKTTFLRLSKNKSLKNIRFIALDLLGFGDSLKADWQNYTFKEFNTAIKNSLKKYHINSEIILVGHSMGCLIAANFTRKNPEKIKKLILVSPPVIKKDEIAKLPDKFYTKTYSSIEKVAHTSSIKTLAKFVESASSFRGKYLDTKAFNETMQNIILSPKNYPIFCELNIPATIIHGRLDPLVIGKNLDEIKKENQLIKLVPVMSSHDISKQKYDKIIEEIERTTKND